MKTIKRFRFFKISIVVLGVIAARVHGSDLRLEWILAGTSPVPTTEGEVHASKGSGWQPLTPFYSGAGADLNVLVLNGLDDVLEYTAQKGAGGQEALYVDAWIYPSGLGKIMRIVNSESLSLYIDSEGQITAKFRNASKTGAGNNDIGEITVCSTDRLCPGAWSRIGVAYRASEGTARIFINGQEVNDYTVQMHHLRGDALLGAFDGTLYIGNRKQLDRGFSGAIAWLYYGEAPPDGPDVGALDTETQKFFSQLADRLKPVKRIYFDGISFCTRSSEAAIAPPDEWKDLSRVDYLEAKVKNTGSSSGRLTFILENKGDTGSKFISESTGRMAPGQSAVIRLAIPPIPPVDELGNEIRLEGMRSSPFEKLSDTPKFDPRKVVRIRLAANGGASFCLSNFCGIGEGRPAPVWHSPDGKTPFFPFVDRYGQHLHGSWDGKVLSDRDFAAAEDDEEKWLFANPPPQTWNQYGGWNEGPVLQATGHFRVEKYKDKWWLVDPEGRLFFSHAPAAVGQILDTRIRGREYYFAEPPSAAVYSFDEANLQRKYGDNWQEETARKALQRLPRWGYNSLGSWSLPSLFESGKISYTVFAGGTGECLPIATPGGLHPSFRDVFDSSFRQVVERIAKGVGRFDGDSYAIGFFVDNEMGWTGTDPISIGTLEAPPTQPAKIRFIEKLKAKYSDIKMLNKAW